MVEPPRDPSARVAEYLKDHQISEIVQVRPNDERSPCGAGSNGQCMTRLSCTRSRVRPCHVPQTNRDRHYRPPPPPPPSTAPQGLIAELLYVKPPDPRKFLIEQLERVKAAGARPLLDGPDLRAMFDMFDVTGTGAVSAAQANAALATTLGGARAAGAAEAAGAAAGPLAARDAAARRLGKEDFVKCVGQVLIRATPNCQLTRLEADDEDGGGEEGS